MLVKRKLGRCTVFLIVVAAGENADFILLDLIDRPMLLIDAAGPAAGEFMLERFGFAGAGEWISLDFTNQLEDTKGLFAVLLHPPGKIFKPGWIKFQSFYKLRQRRCLSFGF